MIRDDADLAPSGVQQRADSIQEGIYLGVYLANKQCIERMTQGVQFAGLLHPPPSPLTAIVD